MVAIDFEFLEKEFYYFRMIDHPNKLYSVHLADFNKKEVINEFINIYGEKIKALNSEVAATYFFSIYGWILSGLQYVLSHYDTALNVSLSNIELQMYYDKEHNYYGLGFRFIDCKDFPLSTERNQWRRDVLEKLYSTNVVPLVNLFHEATNVRLRDLYGQLSIGLYHGHDRVVEICQLVEEVAKIKDDFNFLTKELSPTIFNLKKNPFNISFGMIESPREEGVMIRMKPSCCLYYQTEGATTKCYGCPRMTNEERRERKNQILASMSN
ncbi:MAG: hypothetical protein ACK4M9_04160 [Anaerobacillus sp.]|uniref:hypothetical protein n=1 Tax=Anaerobacillus sp. TaxID=1872506 RepID=UPI00391D161F